MENQSKNIHLLPTDKPSRLYLGDNGNFVFGMMQTFVRSSNDNFTNQNIYITNDEPIKEGDWVLDLEDLTIGKVKDAKDKHNVEINYDNDGIGLSCVVKGCSESLKYPIIKIILTDNKDLIKDGVQAIDDEFLEWFVKNPSCESIEVERNFADEGIKGITYYGKYFLIIPKKEPKFENSIQNTIDIMGIANSMFGKKEELKKKYKVIIAGDGLPKKETLEEEKCVAGCKYFFGGEIKHHKNCFYYNDSFSKMYDDLKSQQEKSYSKEEVKEQLNLILAMKNSLLDTFTDDEGFITDKWFEQF